MYRLFLFSALVAILHWARTFFTILVDDIMSNIFAIILNLAHWCRRCFEFGPVVQEMLFNIF